MGQEEPSVIFEGQLVVTEVLLDVIVTDRQRRPVFGLGKDDFLVEERGREMELTGASCYSTRYADDASGAAPDTIPASRHFVFFFHFVRPTQDPLNRLVRRQRNAAGYVGRWVAEEMQPSDWLAVAGHVAQGLRIFQDFTQDREALIAVLAALERAKDPGTGRLGLEPPPIGDASLRGNLPPAPESGRKRRNVHTSLRRLAEASGRIVGRKVLLYFGIGFGYRYRGDRFASPDRRRYNPMVEALNDNNVAVYPIDVSLPGVVHSQSQFLYTLANDTGGVYHRNTVSFLRPLQTIAGENAAYYLLSYRSSHPRGKRGFQTVRVRTRTPDLVVRARRGYRYGG